MGGALLAGLACGATTKLSTVWKEPGYAGPGLARILVLGVAEDATTRRAFEDRFAQALDARGAQALASYHELPSDGRVRELLARARECGVNLIDTAPAYGTSEERLGALLDDRERWVIVTKAGEEFADGRSHFDFSPEAIIRSDPFKIHF